MRFPSSTNVLRLLEVWKPRNHIFVNSDEVKSQYVEHVTVNKGTVYIRSNTFF